MLWRWPPCGAGSQMPAPQSQRPAEPAQVGSCLSFLCSFVLSSLQCRRGGIGRRAGLKIQRLTLVTYSLSRTVANMDDRKRTETTVVWST